MTPEGKVKTRVKKILAKFKPKLWDHWPVQSGYGAPTLDCTGAISGRAFAIETKAPGEHPTPRQQLTIEEMRAAGIRVFVIGESVVDGYYSGELELFEWLKSHK